MHFKPKIVIDVKEFKDLSMLVLKCTLPAGGNKEMVISQPSGDLQSGNVGSFCTTLPMCPTAVCLILPAQIA